MKEDLEQVKKDIQDYFKIKIEENTNDYLSCEILFNKDKTKAWIGQPHLMRKIEKEFGPMVKGERKLKTPGTPGLVLVKPLDAKVILKPEDQTGYRRGVGTLLYLVKYSRPDIANAVRELSKGMQEPSLSHMKELKRVLKFVLGTKNYGIKMEPNVKKRIALQMENRLIGNYSCTQIQIGLVTKTAEKVLQDMEYFYLAVLYHGSQDNNL